MREGRVRNLVSPVNAAFPSAIAIAMLASPTAGAQERAPVLDFRGVAQSDLLQAFRIPSVDARYGDVGPFVGAGRVDGAGALAPIQFRFGLLDLDKLEASFRLQDRNAAWAPNGRTTAALMDAGAFSSATDYWVMPAITELANAPD